MRALVVYESLWGNTEQIAREVAAGLATTMSVELQRAEDAPELIEGFDLLVVGGPTHAFSMTRASTREGAVAQQGAPRAPARGIREWISGLTSGKGIAVATFDTRVDKPRLPGSAAKAAGQELRSLGFRQVVKPMTFRVHGYEGPLVDGEVARATEWARTISNAASTG